MKFQISTVFRNFVYLFLNQFINLIIPLLVFPFLIKLLGIELFGLYSLTYAGIIFCFMFCDYGFNFSGSKYITINKFDTLKRDSAFSTIISLKLLIALIISIFWILFVIFDSRFEKNLFFGLLFVGMILGNALNLQWFFQGIEQLGWYSIINSIIKLSSNLLILFLIKSSDEIYLIPLIYSSAFLLTGVITMLIAIYSLKINFKFFSFQSYKLFLKDGFDYFVTIGTSSLVFNGTIIILSFFEKNILIIGAFSALDRIIKILVSIYVPYSAAIYPRNMANFNISSKKGKQSVIKYGFIAIVFSVVCVLIVYLFSDLILLFLNKNLILFSQWLQLYSVWIIFIVINNLLGYHFLNGLNKSNVFRNINIIYTTFAVTIMVIGCYMYSFKGCIYSVLISELLLTLMLVYKIKQIKA